MKLLSNWKDVAARAWSLRLIELAAAADIILNLVPYVADVLPWWVTVALLLAAWAARLISQPEKEAADGNKA